MNIKVRRLEFMDASAVNLVASAKDLSPSLYPCQSGIVADATNNYEFGRVSVISRMTPRRTFSQVCKVPFKRLSFVINRHNLIHYFYN